ncbi:hypothetical protein PL263_09255 [Methylomonas sp. EFPC3]|uniref:hypothetical protein n=1 Tax=Methylomonas sp. EFPC3 TaxID=3021710 RepID=UPI002417E065|nr:hypothetical protein [Methylomonas sp. EFPC3]WFP52198.1 hypothetical protein PL263_09255 [Methylomonas sp. EFPC3]
MAFNSREGFDFVESKFLTDSSGRRQIHYYINGIPCPTVYLKDRDAQQAARYRLIIKDLEYVESALSFALKQYPSDVLSEYDYLSSDTEAVINCSIMDHGMLIRRSIYIASVIFYAKTFTEARGRRLKLEAKDVFSEIRDRKTHKKIMEDRHSYLAHAGYSESEAAVVPVILSPNNPLRILEGPTVHAAFLQLPDVDNMTDFYSIVVKLKEYCEKKEKLKLDQLWEKLKDMSIHQLYEMASLTGDKLVPIR